MYIKKLSTLLNNLTVEINHEHHGLFNMPVVGNYPLLKKSYLKVMSYQGGLNLKLTN